MHRFVSWTLVALPMTLAAQRGAPPRPITIHAARVLDGRGGNLGEATITVENGKIARIDRGASAAPPTYELGPATLMPGLIDAHVHLNSYFNLPRPFHPANDATTPPPATHA